MGSGEFLEAARLFWFAGFPASGFLFGFVLSDLLGVRGEFG